MAKYPAMPLWTDAYLGDTTHLTTTEHGAYLLLLIAMWRAPEHRLPNDDARLARFARLTKGQWARMKPTLMEFFTVEGDWLTQGRLTDEAEAVRSKSRKQSERRRARDLKNKGEGSTAVVPRNDRGPTNQNHIQNQEEAAAACAASASGAAAARAGPPAAAAPGGSAPAAGPPSAAAPAAGPPSASVPAVAAPGGAGPPSASAAARPPGELLDRLREAALPDPARRLPSKWTDPWLIPAHARWASLGLGDERILEVLRARRPPDGAASPAYYDRVMQEVAAEADRTLPPLPSAGRGDRAHASIPFRQTAADRRAEAKRRQHHRLMRVGAALDARDGAGDAGGV